MTQTLLRRSVKDMVISAMCVSLALVLPVLLHGVPNAGSVLLPMHLPVLLCGLVTGPVYGLLCGICAPLLSSLITGMPGPAYLPSMLCELAAYGLLSGIFSRVIHTKKPLVDLYLSLLAAMVGGRIAYGIINALIFRAGEYSLTLWLTASFVTALPGIIVQLLVLPAIVLAIRKIRVD